MTFLELAKSRYSCRKYQPIPVEEDKLMLLLEAFRVAPSAANYQPWKIIVVRLPENKSKVIASYPRLWIESAPLLFVACSDHEISWKRNDGKDHSDIDLGIAAEHLILQATELGLGACWVCNFNRELLKINLNLPDSIEPVAIIPIGYPADQADLGRFDFKRKTLVEFVHWEKYGE